MIHLLNSGATQYAQSVTNACLNLRHSKNCALYDLNELVAQPEQIRKLLVDNSPESQRARAALLEFLTSPSKTAPLTSAHIERSALS